MNIRVCHYGGKAPHENLPLVEEQFRLAHRYYNRLVEIERMRRALIPPRCPCGVADAKRHCTCETCRAADGIPVKHCVDATWAFVRAMATRHAGVWAAEYGRRARDVCGVYWGTYLLVEEATDAAKKPPKKKKPWPPPKPRKKPKGFLDLPVFKSWWYVARHRVGVQLQKGLAVPDALAGTDTRLRLVPTGRKRRGGPEYEVRLRIGSEGRAPIWTTMHATLHEPLPPEGRIKKAWIQRDTVGPRYTWSLHVVVQGAPPRADHKVVADRKGVVALDLGWRARPDGSRVGYWLDDQGQHGEVVVPEAIHEGLAHARSIEGIRARAFNAFRDQLAAWLAERVGTLPPWLAQAAPQLGEWKSADRLRRLAERWRRERFAGDEEIVGPHVACPRTASRDGRSVLDCTAHVECWARKDWHLDMYAAGAARRVLARRDDCYRNFAATFARKYAVVVIEKFDLPDVAGRQGLDEDATDGEKLRADRASSRRHVVAPGRFRSALLNACRSRGTRIIERPCAWTTIDCATCGHREWWDAAPAIEHCCAKCGETWDQDENAARNLLTGYLASGPVTQEDSEPLAGGKSARQQRFARRRDRKRRLSEAGRDGRSQEVAQLGEIAAHNEGTVDGSAHRGVE